MVLHDFSSLRLAILNACEGARTARTRPVRGRRRRTRAARHPGGRRDAVRDLRRGGDRVRRRLLRAARGGVAGGCQPRRGPARRCSPSAATTSSGARRCCSCGCPDGRIFDLGDDDRRAGAPVPLARRRRPATSPDADCICFSTTAQDTSGHALLLTDRLGQRFGEDNVHGAVDHGASASDRERLRGKRAFLALIGPGWGRASGAPARPPHRRRRRGASSSGRCAIVPDRVIPVLIDTAMPDRRDASAVAARDLPKGAGGSCGTRRSTATSRD